MVNIVEDANYRIEKGLGTGGTLSRYYQTGTPNQYLFEDGCIHIIRPQTVSAKTYGGMILRPAYGGGITSSTSGHPTNMLVKGHRYVIVWDTKGYTTEAPFSNTWNYNIGNESSTTGLAPAPSNVVRYNPIAKANANVEDWETAYYAFTINDDIFKQCKANHASFVSGITYTSYYQFRWCVFNYATGVSGTSVYLKNVRMYDITNMSASTVTQYGVERTLSFIENDLYSLRPSIFQYGEVRGKNLLEL